MSMTPETLKRLEELNDKWANPHWDGASDPDEIASEVMEHLPDLIAAVKERDIRTQERDACYEELTRIKAERDAAQKACAEMRAMPSKAKFVYSDSKDGIECAEYIQALIDAMDSNCGSNYHHDRDCEPLVRLLVKRGHHHDCAARVGEVSGCIESEHYQHPNKKCTCGLTEALAQREKVKEGK